MGLGEGRPGRGKAEGAAVEVLQVHFSTKMVDASVVSSDNFQQPKFQIIFASISFYPQSGGHSCCAADSTGAVLVQVQLLNKWSMSLVCWSLTQLSTPWRHGWVGLGGGFCLLQSGVGAHHTGDELM